MSYDPGTIFAKILRGEIPSAKVLETDQALAFLDINPVNHGHLLIVPKAEAVTVDELPDAAASHVGSLLPRLCRAVLKATGADGLNIVVNNGECAGQTIPHVHWHIIPRSQADAVHWPWPHSPYSGDELNQMQCRIRKELEGHPED
ncbi:HIT family protein [soil metagenome]